jgi:hypothetical protein
MLKLALVNVKLRLVLVSVQTVTVELLIGDVLKVARLLTRIRVEVHEGDAGAAVVGCVRLGFGARGHLFAPFD